MSASATRGTLNVDVSRIGVSISPSSSICRSAFLLKLLAQVVAAQFPAHGSARDSEHAPEVRLHENPDRVAAQLGRQAAGGGSNAALEAERHRPRTRADRALLNCATLGVFDRGKYVLSRDVPPPDVVQVSVVCFAYPRIDGLDLLVSRQSQHVVD